MATDTVSNVNDPSTDGITGGDSTAPATDWWDTPAAKKLFGLGLSAGVEFLGGNDPKVEEAGYQGGIPDYVAARARVPGTNNPARRPGSGGQRYFTDINFEGPTADTAGLAALNAANPSLESSLPAMAPAPAPMAAEEAKMNPNIEPGFYSSPEYQALPRFGHQNAIQTKYFGQVDGFQSGMDGAYEAYLTRIGQANKITPTPPTQMYAGGIAQLNSGAYLNGASDGMADRIPATIEGSQEARLSDGEFVIPADVVGGLGNGNSSAGAKTLYNMMDRVRMARTGTKKQGTQINPNKMMPV
jgi:hypothetical protein